MFITRFAPSPTGFLHIGNLRTALIAWLYARSQNGKFILRIDDTDKERSRKECEDALKRDLLRCGLHWKETCNQAERVHIYNKYIEFLKEKGFIYECYETKEELDLMRRTAFQMRKNFIYDRRALRMPQERKNAYIAAGRKPHYRFKLNYNKRIVINDQIKGRIEFNPSVMSDPIVIKEDGGYTYLLVSVIDDIEMRVNHVIRGEDHITNTATQTQMFEALSGFDGYDGVVPLFAHLPLLKMPEGKISKRTGGFEIFRLLDDEKILPITLLNYLNRLGSNLETSYFDLSLDDIVSKFNIANYNHASPNFSEEDLERLNMKIICSIDYTGVIGIFGDLFTKNNMDEKKWDTIKNNIENIDEIEYWASILNGDFNYITHEIRAKINPNVIREAITSLSYIEKFDEETWTNLAENIAHVNPGLTKKIIFMSLRYAFTGKEHGPDMKVFLKLLGKNNALSILNTLTHLNV